jgi:hypothetical protein
MTNRALGWGVGIACGALVLVVLGSVVSSPVICGAMPSYSACKSAPVCSAGTSETLRGPGWFCRSRFFDR